MRAAGDSGTSARSRSTSSRGGSTGTRSGIREVAVVVRLLLRAPRGERARSRVEVVGVLLDLRARLPDADLALGLCLDPACDEVEGVHVLDLRAGAELVRPRGADGDVGVDAERALLHLRVRDPELHDRLAQELEEPLRLVRRAQVGSGDDLDERRPAAVEVDQRRVGAADPSRMATDVHRLRSILLEVRSLDSDHTIVFCSG